MNKFLIALLCVASVSFANAATSGHSSSKAGGKSENTTTSAKSKSLKSKNAAWAQNRRGVMQVN